MAKYRVHIGAFSNISSDPDFFIGTGFCGCPISSIEDFKEAMYKYASFEKDGKSYWRNKIKISFNTEETHQAFKNEGDKQCTEQGFVDLLKAAMVAKKDPFHKIYIYFSPKGWTDKEGNLFKVLIDNKGKITPFTGKLSEALKTIGINF